MLTGSPYQHSQNATSAGRVALPALARFTRGGMVGAEAEAEAQRQRQRRRGAEADAEAQRQRQRQRRRGAGAEAEAQRQRQRRRGAEAQRQRQFLQLKEVHSPAAIRPAPSSQLPILDSESDS